MSLRTVKGVPREPHAHGFLAVEQVVTSRLLPWCVDQQGAGQRRGRPQMESTPRWGGVVAGTSPPRHVEALPSMNAPR